MIQLVYASAAKVPFSSQDLNTLLAKARVRNSMYEVTGMLLYDSGSFLQILEGRPEGVDRIYASILRDSRHCLPRVLLREEVDQRDFEAWSMGFVDTSNPLHRAPSHVDYHRVLPGLPQARSQARQFIRFFHQGLCRQAVPA